MAVFTGAGVAIATPFDENYNIDYESFGKFIDFQIENKTDAIIVCGTSGEASTLSHEEHKRLFSSSAYPCLHILCH